MDIALSALFMTVCIGFVVGLLEFICFSRNTNFIERLKSPLKMWCFVSILYLPIAVFTSHHDAKHDAFAANCTERGGEVFYNSISEPVCLKNVVHIN